MENIVKNDSSEFSFAYYEDSTYIYKFPVKYTGMPVNENTEFAVKILSDSSSAVIHKHYDIGKLQISPDTKECFLSFELYRTEDIMENPVNIKFRLEENENFKPLHVFSHNLIVVDGILPAPPWWDIAKFYLGEYKNNNHKLYRKILEYYWLLEKDKPVFYAETLKQYGRYLENAPAGFYQKNNTIIWVKYVLKPAYEYFSDPEHTYEGFSMVNPDRFIH